MDTKIRKFFEKYSISIRNIKYIIREDGKTAIYLSDGRVVSTYHTVKDFKESLPTDQFLYPNKGVLLAADQIVDVGNGAYTMSDGRSFKYRVHNSQLHDMRLLDLGRRIEHMQPSIEEQTLTSLHFSILDKMPLPVCVIERTTSDPSDFGRFVFRYCNDALLEFEGMTREEIVGKSLKDTFPHANPGTVIAYVDVALNGTVRLIEDVNPQKMTLVKLYCYQPAPDYCACVMVKYAPITEEELAHFHSKVSVLN